MFHGTYQKLALRVLLLTVVIYVLTKLVQLSGGQQIYLVHRQFYYDDKQHLQHVEVKYNDQQQSSLPMAETTSSNETQLQLPPGEINIINKQPNLSPIVTHLVKIDQHLLNVAHNQPKFDEYVDSLSSSQVKDLVTQTFGMSNLTSSKAQMAFLKCAGMLALKWHGSQPKSPISLPPSQQHCKKMSFKNSGPVVALASFPGSGNSWVRQLLESATGIYTGAVYCDSAYVKAGMIGEYVITNNVLAVKNHHLPHSVMERLNNDKAIYVVRSPFGAILSENNRIIAKTSEKYRQLGNVHATEVEFNYVNNPKWDKHVKKAAHRWMVTVTQWLNYRDIPVLIVGYENLKKNAYTELKRMLDFIGYPYSEDDVLCAVRSSGESFHRKHARKDLHPYSAEVQEFVLNEIKQVDAALLKHNISLYHPYQKS